MTDDFLEALIADAPTHTGQGIRITPEATWLFRHAIEPARAHHGKRIDVVDLLAGLLEGLRVNPPARSSEGTDRSIQLSFKMANQ